MIIPSRGHKRKASQALVEPELKMAKKLQLLATKAPPEVIQALEVITKFLAD